MSDQEMARQIAVLSGELAALKVAIIALIKNAPNQRLICATLLQDTERLISNTLPSQMPDASAEAIAQTRDLILRHVGA